MDRLIDGEHALKLYNFLLKRTERLSVRPGVAVDAMIMTPDRFWKEWNIDETELRSIRQDVVEMLINAAYYE